MLLVRRGAEELLASPDTVVGPLVGYHHETYVFPFPGDSGFRGAMWKAREPRSNLLWFDRRCFSGEEELVKVLAGRVRRVPEVIDAGCLHLQKFIEGRTLGSLYRTGRAIPHRYVSQLIDVVRDMAAVSDESLGVGRRCSPRDRVGNGDTSGFVERLVAFAEERVYQENQAAFGGLFRGLGIDGDSFQHLRRHLSGLTERPFLLLHADLHRENLIVDPEDRLWVIDWELAMFGDPLYDLATHLHVTRYPRQQADRVARLWTTAIEEVSAGASAGRKRDLPLLCDLKRAQSVFTDVIRAALLLGSGSPPDRDVVARSARRLRRVLEAAVGPLGLSEMPTERMIATELVRWSRSYDSSL
ncbi:phosphotransferase [Streptomyces sp. NPDC093544]|uniref:phosphotransferase n=1 Tax=Streptomyces sp. NPDC093544 TaxID=3155200 RepID=UPI0034210C4F